MKIMWSHEIYPKMSHLVFALVAIVNSIYRGVIWSICFQVLIQGPCKCMYEMKNSSNVFSFIKICEKINKLQLDSNIYGFSSPLLRMEMQGHCKSLPIEKIHFAQLKKQQWEMEDESSE